MLSRLYSSLVIGIEASIIKVEIDIPSQGLPGWNMVGLLETAVKEAKERVASAIRNSGFKIINRKTIINLSPGHVKKSGVHFDLPIAVSLLSAWGIVKGEKAKRYLFAGELSLSGQVLPVPGVLIMAAAAKEAGFAGIVVSAKNLREADLVDSIDVVGANCLTEVVDFINEGRRPNIVRKNLMITSEADYCDFSEVKGQETAKRGLEIAAAGGHNVLMYGPPGTGKTMLAERISTILPPLTNSELIETLKVKSAYGLMGEDYNPNFERPFRAPHHSASYAGLVGGGSDLRMGEISLAHNGVLFMDELPEFNRDVLEVLRQPLESGFVRIVRTGRSVTYPARFMLVAAMNPCRCGYFGDLKKQCICTVPQIRSYRGKVSGPLLDRIDIHINVSQPKHEDLMGGPGGDDSISESSGAILKRVLGAREVQYKRYEGRISCNAVLKGKKIHEYCILGREERSFLKGVADKLSLSARAVHRTLKVARTIADLDMKDKIKEKHLAEAVQFRSFERDLV